MFVKRFCRRSFSDFSLTSSSFRFPISAISGIEEEESAVRASVSSASMAAFCSRSLVTSASLCSSSFRRCVCRREDRLYSCSKCPRSLRASWYLGWMEAILDS
jgi:hypothetical protein